MFKNLLAIFILAMILEFALAQDPGQKFSANEARDDSKLEVGHDFAAQDSFMDDLYQRGPFLMYDCRGKFWVCSGEEEMKRCAAWREENLEKRKENLGCAYFAPFDSRKDCHKKQMEMTLTGVADRLCLHPLAKRYRSKHFNGD